MLESSKEESRSDHSSNHARDWGAWLHEDVEKPLAEVAGGWFVAVQLAPNPRPVVAGVLVEVCTSKGSSSSGPGTSLLGLAII